MTDHLGTPRILADQTGSLAGISRHDYFPFGEENLLGAQRIGNGYSGGDTVRQKYTGYERDAETNLDFAQARYYANLQGRFTSVDPFEGSGLLEEPQSWNRYSYVTNQPTITTDPLGLLATKYFIDGIEASADDVRRLIGAGWGVIAPADIVRYNSRLFNGQGGFEHFRATADGNAGWGYYSSVTPSAIIEAALELGAKWLRPGYKEMGKAGSGVFRSADISINFLRMNAFLTIGMRLPKKLNLTLVRDGVS